MGRIAETNNYDKFEIHSFNRDVKPKTQSYSSLEASMLRYGWLDSFPLSVEPNGNGKYRILRGHTRFEIAKKNRIPIKYVVETVHFPLAEEGITTKPWRMQDYLVSHIRAGKESYTVLKEYYESTGIPLQICISLLSDLTRGGTSSAAYRFKIGTFRVVDTKHAKIVGDLVIHCRNCGLKFYKSNNFVNALSTIARAKDFSPEVLKSKIKTFGYLMEAKATSSDYIILIEYIYNYRNREKVPLKFNAEQAARERKLIGVNKINKNKRKQ